MEVTVFRLLRAPVPIFSPVFCRSPLSAFRKHVFSAYSDGLPRIFICSRNKKQREPRLTLRESGLSLSSPQFGRQPSAPVPKKTEKAATTVKICIAFSDQFNDELQN